MNSETNNDNSISAVEGERKEEFGLPFRLIVVILSVIVLGSLYVYFYFTQTQLNDVNDVTQDIPITTSVPVQTIDETFANERLQEIDQGQGLVGINLSASQDLFITDPINGRALYQLTEGLCNDECLNDWSPLLGTEPFEGDRLRSVLVNEELNLHHVTLDDKMLFTYIGDDIEGDINRDGLGGSWTLARP